MFKNTIAFTKEFYSGDWCMVISNEPPMTNNGKIYCKFDLIKNKNNFWCCPVNQFGTIEEVLKELKRWKNEVDSDNKYMLDIENHFIQILEG